MGKANEQFASVIAVELRDTGTHLYDAIIDDSCFAMLPDLP